MNSTVMELYLGKNEYGSLSIYSSRVVVIIGIIVDKFKCKKPTVSIPNLDSPKFEIDHARVVGKRRERMIDRSLVSVLFDGAFTQAIKGQKES